MSIKKDIFAPLASGLGASVRRAAMMLLMMMLTTATAWATTFSTINVGGTDYTLFTGFTATGGSHSDYGNMVDGSTSTSYHVFASSAYVEFNADDPIVPKGYIFNTYMDGNFFPTSWVLKAKADMFADFFDNILVLPDLHANGRMTLGENLADHGGLQVSWTAYKKATKDHPLPTIDGLTADQRFFLANAGVWAQNITEAEIRHRTVSDVHSLGRWRVNGAFPHIDAWYDTYGVKEGDKMYLPKDKRLELW